MLSYSVNTTFRSDEIFWSSDYTTDNRQNYYPIETPPEEDRPPYGSNAWPNSNNNYNFLYPTVRPPNNQAPQSKNCEDYIPRSLSPWENGVVWSSSGPFAAGTMLAGLAAGLEPQTVTWSAGLVDNGYGATLAGDLGQTAIMKRRDEPYIGPDGYFNSTICPNEFYMRLIEVVKAFSHLTTAEINGGLDGLLMSLFAHSWERNSEYTLSQIIDMYYSPHGIKVQGSTPLLSACDRYANYYKLIPADKLSDQAYVFGTELKNVLVLTFDETSLRTSIAAAKDKLDIIIKILDQSLNNYGPCKEQRERDGYPVEHLSGYQPSPIDYKMLSSGIADVAVILDSSIVTQEDEFYMLQVAAALANELDIWTTAHKLSGTSARNLASGGSTLELSDGRYGNVIISSQQKGDFTNKAHLACQILQSEFPRLGTVDPAKTLEVTASRLISRAIERQNNEMSAGKALVILMMMFGRIPTGDKKKFNDAVYRIRRNYPSVHLLLATRWAPESEYAPYVLFPSYDIFLLEQYNEELKAESDGRRIAKRIAQIPGI
jgi:hypothetical protein